jgi:prefoldin alpha subunit
MAEEKKKANGDEQRKLQSLLMQIRSYQATLQEISRQAALTEQAVRELSDTIQAIEELPKTNDKGALVPIGAGVYTKAELLDKGNFIVASGAGVHTTKTAADTKKLLEERKSQIAADDKKLKEQAQKIAHELEAANKTAEELYAKLQGKQ